MTNKQNLAIWKELNEIELERAVYLINSDELIFETVGEGDESGRLTKSVYMGVFEEIKILQSQLGVNDMTLIQQYKCPTCKHEISITRADFISGIASTFCGECGTNGVAMDDVISYR
jgi:hypothetical protein